MPSCLGVIFSAEVIWQPKKGIDHLLSFIQEICTGHPTYLRTSVGYCGRQKINWLKTLPIRGNLLAVGQKDEGR